MEAAVDGAANESEGSNASEAADEPFQVVSCPPADAALNLAQAFASAVWVRVGCVDKFPSGSILLDGVKVRHIVAGRHQVCEVRLRYTTGQLRLVIDPLKLLPKDAPKGDVRRAGMERPHLEDSFSFVANASIRTAAFDAWAPLDSRLCLLSPRVGFVPVPGLETGAVEAFVLKAVNEQRMLRRCGGGGSLRLLDMRGVARPAPRATIIGRASLLHIAVLLGAPGPEEARPPAETRGLAAVGSGQWVMAAVEAFQSLRDAGHTAALTFLGSSPDPCGIGTSSGSTTWPTPSLASPPPVHVTARRVAREAVEDEVETLPVVEALSRAALRAKGVDELPAAYDFRESAPECVLAPRRQGICAGAWALAAAGSFEKQACALSRDVVQDRLSAQRILDCAPLAGCSSGGSLADAFAALFAAGAPPDECLPWSAAPGRDSEGTPDLQMPFSSPLPPPGATPLFAPAASGGSRLGAGLPSSCPPLANASCSALRARAPSLAERALAKAWPSGPPGAIALPGARAILAAIFAYGAVTSAVEVYPDFLSYSGGVYQRAPVFGVQDLRGVTAVQLLGWGKEGGVKWWIGENTFGEQWGEAGYFRWIRDVDHLGIESHAVLGLVAGLDPLAPADGGAKAAEMRGLPGLSLAAVEAEARAQALDRSNFWLAALAVASWVFGAWAVVSALRRCLCMEEGEDSPDGDIAPVADVPGDGGL